MSTIASPRQVVREVTNSASPGLSSPPSPNSPRNQASGPAAGLTRFAQNGNLEVGSGVEKGTAVVAKNTAGPKRPRKKKESGDAKTDLKSTTTPDAKRQPAKPRKPRVPRNSAVSSSTIKKEPTAGPTEVPNLPPTNAPRQTQITDSLGPPSAKPLTSVPTHQNGIHEAIPASHNPSPYLPPIPPRPASGQNYDPIRSATIEPRTTQQIPFNGRTSASTPPRPPSNASVSPSIASLLEPHSTAPSYLFPGKDVREVKAMSPSPPKRPRLSPPECGMPGPTQSADGVATSTSHILTNTEDAKQAIDADIDQRGITVSKFAPANKKASGNSSSRHSPKLSSKKESSVHLPSGNGLLSSAMLGGRGFDNKGPERSAPTVVLHVPLDGSMNKYVNFARLAEEQYGFDALHPRLAAQRERLARVAAAGAALENVHKTESGRSADEMSVDLSEGEQEGENSNVEMTGINGNGINKLSGGEGSEATIAKKPRKRTMKEDMYDKEDPFVDDTELAWEEQAAASKDGFFVYSGPLVPEGEKANIERYALNSP